jgi:hypothetical protein
MDAAVWDCAPAAGPLAARVQQALASAEAFRFAV